ncbi:MULTISPECIES: glycosyltransferase family 4 protein [Pseudomonas]|uniref:MraY family glycosyltransferase n=1 Tax=Pseudomonas TaxID=286 RepID=UPI000A1ED3A1|nr:MULTISPECIES: glycosyltransferase family 4 protein [Pseudomonas]MCX4219520.1 glycosyltransferase family 4 protein [Pseudomonas sp. MCal1]UDI91403.1 glycosyltransferase family 4 protein [Pseudomonas sp. IAC-BECa141]UIN54925.1 glycosyltransferase family 4 protein [Pseudomonas kribbensis]
MNFCWLAPALAGLSFVLTATLRRYAMSRSLLDVPNDRSSHSMPTPRGGGVAIVLSFLAALGLMYGWKLISFDAFVAFLGAGGVIAVIGFLDDHGHIAARWRLLAHFVAAGWGVYWLGGLAPVTLFGFTLDSGWSGHLLAVIYLVWMLNLYNFMDGIDGIASIEAMSVCLGAALLYWVSGAADVAWPSVMLAACVAGFLCWNFPPAKIFMGDAGSGFLGIVLGLMSLQAAWNSPGLLWGWLILLGVFIVDATFTLLRRLIRGDKVYEAHRSHAYQFASRVHGAHLPVTLTVGLINLLWLLPLALGVVVFHWDGALVLILAYLPLVWLAVRYEAGQLESRSSNT